jgi:hypothetical protein
MIFIPRQQEIGTRMQLLLLHPLQQESSLIDNAKHEPVRL